MEWQSLLGVKSFLSSFDRFCLPVTLNLISVQKNELNKYCCINIMWRWDQELLQNRALIVSEQILIFDPPVHRAETGSYCSAQSFFMLACSYSVNKLQFCLKCSHEADGWKHVPQYGHSGIMAISKCLPLIRTKIY